MEEKFGRFKDALWAQSKVHTVVIGGVGGIGSWLSLLLARTGICDLMLVDPDTVEKINLGGQLFSELDVGISKIEAVSNLLYSYASPLNTRVNLFQTSIQDLGASPIVFSCFDNMEARQYLFTDWKSKYIDHYSPENAKNNPRLFVDGRLLAERFQVYFITPDRIEEYEKMLFDDSEVEQESCTYKATSHFAAMIAARMVQGFTNHVTNFIHKDDLYEVPFLVTEEGPLYLTETHDNINSLKHV